eukprot:scaffold171479_cov33-Cyclotella_meneghiniana.AAC.1
MCDLNRWLFYYKLLVFCNAGGFPERGASCCKRQISLFALCFNRISIAFLHHRPSSRAAIHCGFTLQAIIMSSAAARAIRAGIREGSGSGAVGGAAAGGQSSNHPEIPSLIPSDDAVIKNLQGRTILKLDEKYHLFRSFYELCDAFVHSLQAISLNAAQEFNAIEWSGKLLKKYPADFLGKALFLIYQATKVVRPSNTANYNRLTIAQQDAITSLHKSVRIAISDASTTLNNSFANSFLSASSLPPGEYDRKYLENGYVPTVSGYERCLCCGFTYCDEPNSNRAAILNNEAKKARYDAQLLEDEQKRQRGEVVLNNKNVPMADGRKRTGPKYETIFTHCHAGQFSCSTEVGDVPESECPIKCIDPNTGERYFVDLHGNCQCPVCQCDCNAIYS